MSVFTFGSHFERLTPETLEKETLVDFQMWDLTLNVGMYILIFAAALYIWKVEHIDVHCPNFNASSKECEDQGGMAFSGSKPNDTDDCPTLIRKIRKGAGAEPRSIKWRRSFLLSVSIMLIASILVITPGALPDWKTFYLSVLISFAVLFASYVYYSYHVYGLAERWMEDAIDELEQKKCFSS